ncbi:hypothetical protein TRFO_36616 [Tritrichomonas foetus]|uniref:Uncharacterized protein n=1 Tax=Tritrichomonas foetus TaxID=1144522 RepID=A0A1J4JFY0_9EUKA|nr:hypothetical protein TRFO_36616 [Tritrichomonas foetus]|eukprot:OHS97199.1 hypothetical protein TRFO_36616 [Tritrichomonas foetus]
MNHRSLIPPLQFPGDFPDMHFMEHGGIRNPKINVREFHRDSDYENPYDLISQKFSLLQDITALRRENDSYKKLLLEIDREIDKNIKDEIEIEKFYFGSTEEIDDKENVRHFLKQHQDLNVELTELMTQFNFLSSYFTEHNERELRSYSGLQSHQKEMDQTELSEMDRVLKKAVTRMNGPVAEAQERYSEAQKKIQLRKKQLQKLYKIESQYIFQIEHFHDQEILPEELEVELNNAKHALKVLKHRRYNREKELNKYQSQKVQQKVTASELKVQEAKILRERKEREKFRKMMQEKKLKKRQEDERRLLGICHQKETNEDEENWRMITFVKEAKDEM